MSTSSETMKLDENGRIQLPADLRARLNIHPGDEFVIGEATNEKILLQKMDLAAIMKGIIFNEYPAACCGDGQETVLRKAAYSACI